MDSARLEQARAAAQALEQAEEQMLKARAEYHAAVRLLHLDGASLRAIAEELNLSHQRVQQIVDGSGGSWWKRTWSTRRFKGKAACTSCGRSHDEVAKLIAGPGVFICDECVKHAEAAARASTPPESNFALASLSSRQTCHFCDDKPALVRSLVAKRSGAGGGAAGPVNICSDCLTICRELIRDGAA